MILFNFSKVFFLINLRNVHWCLVIFYPQNKIKKIVLYDSMKGNSQYPFQVNYIYLFDYIYNNIFILRM